MQMLSQIHEYQVIKTKKSADLKIQINNMNTIKLKKYADLKIQLNNINTIKYICRCV